MKNVKFEIYENNGGGLFLVIFDSDCNPIRIFENWEYGGPGILADAIKQLEDSPSAYEWWDEDLMERLAIEREDLGLPEITIADMYDKLNGNDVLIADSNCMYPDRMGSAAQDALGVIRE